MKLPRSFGKPKKLRLFVRRVVGNSMLPTLTGGQIVLFMPRRPKIGDIVMIKHDDREKIKRVARLDTARLYVLGDNPEASTDSRDFGWLGMESVIAVLVWPRRL